jgi:23S rRNA (pseudouridine1915-N3)-methyltransferase
MNENSAQQWYISFTDVPEGLAAAFIPRDAGGRFLTMQIHLISVGTRAPPWVEEAFNEYVRRLPRGFALRLVEIAATRRKKGGDTSRSVRDEGHRMLAAVPGACRVVALAEDGQQWSSLGLAEHLRHWLQEGTDVAWLVGGPDGLSSECRRRAEDLWSLSRLTFPHALVRVVLAEQLYRACSILARHPYHRL